MYGAVFGDIIGSWYEWHNQKSEDIELFPREARFTDDTVLTVAIADSILHMEDNPPRKCYASHIKMYYRRYPGAGFGNMIGPFQIRFIFSAATGTGHLCGYRQ